MFSDLCSPTTFFFGNFGNFSKYRTDIWIVRPDGHLDRTNVRTDILTKFDLEKNFCSSVPGHVLSRIAKSLGRVIEIVRARPVLGTWIVPSAFQQPRTDFGDLACPNPDILSPRDLGLGHPSQDMAWNSWAKVFFQVKFWSKCPAGHLSHPNVRTFKCPFQGPDWDLGHFDKI